MRYEMLVPFSLIVIDVITGILKGIYTKSLSSSIIRRGLFRKLAEVIIIGLSFYGEVIGSFIEIEIPIPLLSAACAYIGVMEIVSIVENLCEINPQIANLFGDLLKKNNKKGE